MKFKKKKKTKHILPTSNLSAGDTPEGFICVCVCVLPSFFYRVFFLHLPPRALLLRRPSPADDEMIFFFWKFFFMEGVGWAPLSQFLIKKKPKKKNKLTLFLTGVRWKCFFFFFLLFFWNFFFLTSQEKKLCPFFLLPFFFLWKSVGHGHDDSP